MSDIKDYIQVTDNILNPNVVPALFNYAETTDYKEAKIVSDGKSNDTNVVDMDIRRTYVKPLGVNPNKRTETHWYNLLFDAFGRGLKNYMAKFPFVHPDRVLDISILKYNQTGFYDWHVDAAPTIPRTLSCILLLNDNYAGGELCFQDQTTKTEMKVDVKANRLIMWPSSFMYPHTVKPVTSGRRYSIVAWYL